MKKAILFLLIISSFSAQAQSLKDLLYGGKLKMDSNTVVRRTDDLSTKIDTTTKKPEAEKSKAIVAVSDSSAKRSASLPDAAVAGTGAVAIDSAGAVATMETPVVAAKNNNQIWKAYIDSLTATLKTEVLTSKKIKKETYFLYVDYEIGTDGQVTINNVVATPENEFLQNQVKERLLLGAPQLSPVIDSTGKPRKVKRKHNFSITKE